MNADEISRDARMHAALGSPSRLALARMLRTADRTPTQLAGRLGMASNLMAHHTATLVEAGVVQRITSQADRRRVYLTLTPQGRRLVGASTLCAQRILFVCTHNSARSQFADALWRQACPIPSSSAGTDPAPRIHPLAVEVAKRKGLDLGQVVPRRLSPADLRGALVVTVCDHADQVLVPAGVEHLHWSVGDPALGARMHDFVDAFDQIADRVADLVIQTEEKP